MTDLDTLLDRGVANIIPNRETLSKTLSSKRKLNIYLGIDPTATRLHLGHTVPLRKLQQFVAGGHHVYFLIGDFTALIGDTSDKDSERPVLTYEQIQANFQTYKEQASKLLDFSKVEVVHNGDWLKELKFTDIVKLCQHFSTGDFINRELMKKRLASGTHVGLHEVLYPVMQGYDSYHLDTDIQIGGTDQTYNMQAGRILQKDLRNKESFVLSVPFLLGTDGRKMSKSWGNAIWMEDAPSEMYGKVMSIKDELLSEYFTLATNLSSSDFPDFKNPMQAKKILAHTIVSEMHEPKEADLAQKEFEAVFQSRGVPQNIPQTTISAPTKLSEIILNMKLVSSNSEFKRLVSEKGIKIDEAPITDPQIIINPGQKHLVKIGKLRFFNIN